MCLIWLTQMSHDILESWGGGGGGGGGRGGHMPPVPSWFLRLCMNTCTCTYLKPIQIVNCQHGTSLILIG